MNKTVKCKLRIGHKPAIIKYVKFTFIFSQLAHFYLKQLTNEDNRSNQNQQKSYNM